MAKYRPKFKVTAYDPKRHLPQEAKGRLDDFFFILLILFYGEQNNVPVSVMNLLKTLFMAKIRFLDEGYKFFNTPFYIYKYGPFNEQIYKYLDDLQESGLVTKEGNTITLTFKGLGVAAGLTEEFAKESNMFKEVESTVTRLILRYQRASHAISDSHSQVVMDETDNGKVKTIDDIAKDTVRIRKCIEPVTPPSKTIVVPNNITNRVLDAIAEVEGEDYKQVITYESAEKILEA